MGRKEFLEWQFYDHLEPGEPTRGDYQAAVVATTVAMAHRAKGRRPKIADYLLKFGPKVQIRKSAKEIETKLKTWLAAYNSGRDKQKKKEAQRAKKIAEKKEAQDGQDDRSDSSKA